MADEQKLRLRKIARNKRKAEQRARQEKTPVARIRAWWGMDWHELLAMLHAQGLTREQCAQAMGYKGESGLQGMLRRNPQHDPWGVRRTVPAQYFIDTGETFPAAARRMMAEGKTITEAMVEVGYTSKSNVGFKAALRQYGIEDNFVRALDPSRPRTPQHARRLELKAGAPKKVRQKRAAPKSKGGPHPWIAVINREARAGEQRRKKKENA